MVSEVEFELHAVGIDLYADFAVEDLDAAAAPFGGFAEFGEVDAGEEHALGLEEQVIALFGVVVENVVGMLAVGAQEEVQELGREARRLDGQGEFGQEVLQPAPGLHRTPREADVFAFGGDLLL